MGGLGAVSKGLMCWGLSVCLGAVSEGLMCWGLSVCLGAVSEGLIMRGVDILLIPSQEWKMVELRILLQSQYKPKEGIVI